tara:strand:- start:6 stop:488 length:483 start_codon:yes stop_codon:yes gene_type:complete
MKKILLILLVCFTISSCGLFKKDKSNSESQNGWYYLSDENDENALKVSSDIYDKDFYVKSPAIVNSTEFKELNMSEVPYRGQEKIKMIDVILNENASEKWADATERISKSREMLVFVFNKKVISQVGAMFRIENGHAGISSPSLTEEELNNIIEQLKREK